MIKQDYKSQARPVSTSVKWFKSLHLHWGEITAIALGILLLAFALGGSDSAEEAEGSSTETFALPLDLNDQSPSSLLDTDSPDFLDSTSDRLPLPLSWAQSEALAEEPADTEPTSTPSLVAEREVSVRSGDSLSTIFSKQGLSARDVFEVTSDPMAKEYLSKILPGKKLIFKIDNDGRLLALHYLLSINETLEIRHTEQGYHSELKSRPIETCQAFVSGIIQDSLFNAGKKQGLSDTLIVKLANIFGWDIDFALDVRANDSFAMIYEQKFLDDQWIGDGDILVAQFVNQGDIFQAVRYQDSKGDTNYFSPSGDSMRKAFLRSPVNFLYISSNFNPKRFHPILKRYKAHNGIDYRAPTGTPVYASGDGKVIASSFNQYNGKYVFIQHGNSIVTKYLHLSKRTVANGKRVRQGEIIGYVGATGMAEAPHLHYEFLVNGVHRNPRTVTLPQAQPIDKQERAQFEAATAPLIAGLAARTRMQTQSSGH